MISNIFIPQFQILSQGYKIDLTTSTILVLIHEYKQMTKHVSIEGHLYYNITPQFLTSICPLLGNTPAKIKNIQKRIYKLVRLGLIEKEYFINEMQYYYTTTEKVDLLYFSEPIQSI